MKRGIRIMKIGRNHFSWGKRRYSWRSIILVIKNFI